MRSAARDPAAVRGWSKSRGYWDRWSLHTLCPQQPWACLITLLPLALVVFSELNHLPWIHGSLPFWTLTLLDQALNILLLDQALLEESCGRQVLKLEFLSPRRYSMSRCSQLCS